MVYESLLARLTQTLYLHLPNIVQRQLKVMFPEWTLPNRIILKMQKSGQEEDFDNEKITYHKLQELQGRVIPVLYGEISYNGVRALVLSDIGGASMAELGGALVDNGQVLCVTDFESMLSQALWAMAARGILYDDIKLDNFRRVDGASGRAVMVVDLERADQVDSREHQELCTQDAIHMLVRQYCQHLDCLRHDGLLLSNKDS